MANTVPTPVDAMSQAALEGFKRVFAPVNAFSTNFSQDAKSIGDGVQVNLYERGAAAQGFAGDYTSNSDSTVTAVTVPLTTHVFRTVHVTDEQKANNGIELNKLAAWAGEAVATYIATGVMGVLTTGTFGTPMQTLGSAANMHPSGMLAALATGAAWGPDKSMIATPGYYTSLLGNLPSNTTVQNDSIREGSIGRVYGFDTYMSDVPQLVASDANTKVIFAHPSAVAVAIRPLNPDHGGAYKSVQQVTDDTSKLTLTTRNWYSADKGLEYFTVECNAGWVRGITGAAKVIHGG